MFLNYLTSKHPSIKFTAERENNEQISFLDISIKKDGNRLATNTYSKPTSTGLYTIFTSFIPTHTKLHVFTNLLHRSYKICSTYHKFHEEVTTLIDTFIRNRYPRHLLERLTRQFVDKVKNKQTVQSTDKTKQTDIQTTYISIPFTGRHSLQLRNRLQKLYKRYHPNTHLRVAFKTLCHISSLFPNKDRIPTLHRSSVVYNYKCSSCNAAYIGKTMRHLLTRADEHHGISSHTGKTLQTQLHSSIRNHCQQTSHPFSYDNFNIISSARSDFELSIKESLWIHNNRPNLNNTTSSFPIKIA